MKLYTEEQVRKAIAMGFYWSHQKHIPNDLAIDNFIKELTPIELPSDEEVHKQAINYSGFDNEFEAGAKWMRDKIQGGNK